jgi:hypothetical protein
MATIVIDISDEQAAELAANAKEQGLTLEELVRKAVAKEALFAPPAEPGKRDIGALARRFKASIARLPKTPVLSDYAMSRESIYEDRD